MLIQSNGSYPFSNSFSTAGAEKETADNTAVIEKLKDDYNMILQELNPSERKLYNTLISAENYQAARGVVTIGFMRAAGLYTDDNGNPLSGASLIQDLSKLNPPASPKERSSLDALQNHLIQDPLSIEMDPTRRGNLLDLKI